MHESLLPLLYPRQTLIINPSILSHQAQPEPQKPSLGDVPGSPTSRWELAHHLKPACHPGWDFSSPPTFYTPVAPASLIAHCITLLGLQSLFKYLISFELSKNLVSWEGHVLLPTDRWGIWKSGKLCLAQGQRADEEQGQKINPDLLLPRPAFFLLNWAEYGALRAILLPEP